MNHAKNDHLRFRVYSPPRMNIVIQHIRIQTSSYLFKVILCFGPDIRDADLP